MGHDKIYHDTPGDSQTLVEVRATRGLRFARSPPPRGPARGPRSTSERQRHQHLVKTPQLLRHLTVPNPRRGKEHGTAFCLSNCGRDDLQSLSCHHRRLTKIHLR